MARSRPTPKAERRIRQDTFLLLKTKRQLTKAIIPAAGMGTRIRSLTEGLPKEMLPIGDRPMIFYAIQEAVLSGIEELYIIINSSKDTLRRYLESDDLQSDIRSERQGRDCSWPRLTFVEQPFPAGSGDAIYRARDLIGDEPCALMLPDFILFTDTPALGQLIPLYERCGCDVGGILLLQGEEVEGFGNVGIIQGDEVETGIVSVRSLSNKVSAPLIIKEEAHILKAAPRWILGSHFFSYLEKTKEEGEWDDAPALQLLCAEQEVVGKVLKGKGFDMGNPSGYQAAQAFAAHLDAGVER